MTNINRQASLEEVIDNFFYDSELPDAKKLQAAINAYPEYQADLIDFAVLWSAYEHNEDVTENLVEPVSVEEISKLQSFALNRIYELGVHNENKISAKNALDSLAGNALRRAAQAAALFGSADLLQKILNNGITDVPSKVIKALSEHLSVPIDLLREAILERGYGGAKSYKSSKKPIVLKNESWANAVKNSTLPDDQKKILITYKNEE